MEMTSQKFNFKGKIAYIWAQKGVLSVVEGDHLAWVGSLHIEVAVFDKPLHERMIESYYNSNITLNIPFSISRLFQLIRKCLFFSFFSFEGGIMEEFFRGSLLFNSLHCLIFPFNGLQCFCSWGGGVNSHEA